MWVRTSTATVVFMSLSKTLYHNWFSPPRSKWVPMRAEMVAGMIYAAVIMLSAVTPL